MRAATGLFLLFFALELPAAAMSPVAHTEVPPATETPLPVEFQGVSIGPEVVDAEGRKGRLHRVVDGDTLWDISEAYLGTAWAWPSVWQENGDIANPHRIYPGDTIWISHSEMRVLRGDELAALWRQASEADVAALESRGSDSRAPSASGASLPVGQDSALGFLTESELVAASSIVGSPEDRTWLADRDPVYIGLGHGEVSKGDRFTIFRDPVPVFDIESRRKIGYHVQVVGWLEVTELSDSSSVARIRHSNSEIARGDRLMRRNPRPDRVSLRDAPVSPLAGRIVFTPGMRSVLGTQDTVYLNRGQDHGLEAGVALEVFEGGSRARDRVRSTSVRTPDHVVAELIVIRVRPESAVAVVTQTARELEVGDHFRTVPSSELAGL